MKDLSFYEFMDYIGTKWVWVSTWNNATSAICDLQEGRQNQK